MPLKNFIIKNLLLLLKPLFPLRTPQTPPSRFLILSTTALGDTLWATPALKALKMTYPNAHISVLTSGIGKEVLQSMPYIDEIFELKKNSFFSLLMHFPRLRKKRFDTVFLFHVSQRCVVPLASLLGAPIIGNESSTKGLDFLLSERLPLKNQHEIVRRCEIVSRVGAITVDFSLEMPLDRKEIKEAEELLESYAIPPYIPLVGIHPGSKDLFKRWPPSLFREVGNRLAQNLGCQIFVTGTSSEKNLVEEVASGIQGAIPLAGTLRLRSLAALIKRCSVFLTNDTGPMHIACAMKTPVIALFTPTDFKLCGPYQMPRAAIIQKKTTCFPCLRKKCNDPFCLLQISADEVYEEATRVVVGHV